MNGLRFRAYLAPLSVMAYLLSFMLSPMAGAGMIGTQQAMDQQAHAAQVERVQALMAQDAVAEQMAELGVDPLQAQARVASLTHQELSQLEGHLQDLPAGSSALAVIGVVFLVLLILELVGVTNVFSNI
jgi:hypothetical protein